jgi:hypothetical protein
MQRTARTTAMLFLAGAFVLSSSAVGAAVQPSASSCNCSYTGTDVQCPSDVPPGTCELGQLDNVNSSAACGVACEGNPKCFASAWSGGTPDHWNQCWLKGNGTTLVPTNITNACICRGPLPTPLPPHDYTRLANGRALTHQLLEWKGNPKMCLSGPVKPGVFTVGVAPCNGTSKAQQWTQNLASQFIVNVADNQCLNAVQTGGVTLVACMPGLMDVQWTYSKTGELVSGSTSFCLTVKGSTVTQASCSATAKSDLWTWKNVTA